MSRTMAAVVLMALLLLPLGGIVSHAASTPARHTTGEQNVLILPVDFEDTPNSVSIQHLASLANESNYYIKAASYNQTWLNVTTAQSWTMLNGTFADYTYSSSLGGCPSLVRDALARFQDRFVISSFDHVVIVHSGNQFYSMRPEEIDGQFCSTVNVAVKSVIIISESDNYLSLTHELMHSIGGYFVGPTGALTPWVQDLYSEQAVQAHTYSPIYVGNWDLMSDEQNGLTAWTKLKLGWIQPSQVVTLDSWSNTVVNLSALEVPGGIKVVQIPVAASKVSFENGTTINALSYYVVEYREATGIDKNITSTVLVTLGNNTRFYDRIPGPLTEVNHLDTGNTVWVTFSKLNLTIALFQSNDHSALVAFLKPNQVQGFLNSAGKVNQALQEVQQHSQVIVSWSYVQPPLNSMQRTAEASLVALTDGNLNLASNQAEMAIASLNQWESGTSQMLWLLVGAIDVVALSIFLLVGVLRRTKEGTGREYVFTTRSMVTLILVVVITAGLAGYLELAGLSSTGIGISSGTQSSFSQGIGLITNGAVIALLGSSGTAWAIRQGWNVYEVELFDVVDQDDVVVGRKAAKVCLRKGLLHRAVAVLLFDKQGKLYIQKRAGDMHFYPGHWSISCTGHVSTGETYGQAARREVKEELGLDCELEEVAKVLSPKWKLDRRYTEWEYITVFKGEVDNPKIALSDETAEGKWVPIEEFERILTTQPGVLTPDSVLAFEIFRKPHSS